MLELYSQGMGSAAKEAEKSANNWSGSWNKVRNSWSDLIQNFADSDTIIGAINVLNNLIIAIDKLSEALGGLPTLAGIGAGLFAGFKDIDIFKTINNVLGSATEKIGIFNRSFSDLGQALKTGGAKGLANSMSSFLTPKDISNINNYNAELQKIIGYTQEGGKTVPVYTSAQTAFNRTMLDSSKTAQELVTSNKGAAVSQEVLNSAMKKTSASAKVLNVALKGLSIAGNMLVFMAVSKGIELAVKAIDNYIHRMERANEATIEANNNYESIASEVNTLKDKIAELNKLEKDPLTNEEDLENIKAETVELNNQLKILEEKARLAKQEADEKAKESLGMTQTSRYATETYEQYDPTEADGVREIHVAAQTTKVEELELAIAKHKEYRQEILALEAELAGMTANDAGYDEKTKTLDGLKESAKETRTHMNELSVAISEESAALDENNEESKVLLEQVNEAQSAYTSYIDEIDGATNALKENAEAAEDSGNANSNLMSLEELNNQVDSIQDAYKSLTTACDEYNQNGYITMDTLQSLLSLNGEYLSCLVNENGQLQINGTTYQELVKAKLADAEATAVQQAIDELAKVEVENKTQADITATQVTVEKAKALAALSGSYGAVATSAAAAAQAEALYNAYETASGKNQAEADRIMSNLNAKLALIQSTTEKTSGSFGALTNHLNGFEKSSGKAANATDELTKSMQKQKDALEEQQDALKKQKQYYEDVIEAINWFYDKKIDDVKDSIDAIERENELIQEQLEMYNGILSAIDRYYEEQQNKLRERIDAMEKENDEAKRALEIEKAKDALIEARNRKSVMQYEKGKGFVYSADQSEIKSAEENLANIQQEQKQAQVKAELEAEIELLQKYRDAWAEIPDVKQKAEQDSQMIQTLGAEWESILLEGRLTNITSFKDNYVSLQKEIDDNTGLIESYNQKIEYYESLKEEWEELTSRYEEETYRQLLISAFGNDYENELLNGRTSRWEQFADEYYDVQVQLKDVTDKIESLAQRMESYAKRMEDAATRAVQAVAKINSAKPDTSGWYTGGWTSAISGKAKGGIITRRDSGDLDFIARNIGEDHMIAMQEGEAVIPKQTVAANKDLISSLLSANGKSILNDSISYDMSKFVFDEIPTTGFSIGNRSWNNDVKNFKQQTILNFNGDLSFPNIKSGDDAKLLVAELSQLSRKADQRARKRN